MARLNGARDDGRGDMPWSVCEGDAETEGEWTWEGRGESWISVGWTVVSPSP